MNHLILISDAATAEETLFGEVRQRAIDCGLAVVVCSDSHHAREVHKRFSDWLPSPLAVADSAGLRVRWGEAEVRFVSVRSGSGLDWNKMVMRIDGRECQTTVHPVAIAEMIGRLARHLEPKRRDAKPRRRMRSA